MRFEGDRLRDILADQSEPVQVRDGYGGFEIEYRDPRAALPLLDRGKYYGVGNKKRIRYVQADGVAERVEPWGTKLDTSAPKGAVAPHITTNVTRKDSKHWKQRPDSVGTGRTGIRSQLRF